MTRKEIIKRLESVTSIRKFKILSYYDTVNHYEILVTDNDNHFKCILKYSLEDKLLYGFINGDELISLLKKYEEVLEK